MSCQDSKHKNLRIDSLRFLISVRQAAQHRKEELDAPTRIYAEAARTQRIQPYGEDGFALNLSSNPSLTEISQDWNKLPNIELILTWVNTPLLSLC